MYEEFGSGYNPFEEYLTGRCSIFDKKYECQILRDEDAILDTHTSWNSPQADKERTIFGEREDGLEYNYSDRLSSWDYDKHIKANEYAGLIAKPKTAKYYAAMLSYFHDGAKINLRHIVAGCNRSNGHPYLVFGYKLGKKSKSKFAKYERIRTGISVGLQEKMTEFSQKFEQVINDILKDNQ